MALPEIIEGAKESLRSVIGKINAAIRAADQADTKSSQAIDIANGSVETANDAKTTSETVRSEFDQVVAEAGSNNPEVVNSRGTFPLLKNRLDDVDVQLAQKATKDELNALGQLKVEGVYATLVELQTAKPTGATGLYLITADGYTYRWNGSAWVQAAQFQTPYSTDFPITNGASNGDFSNGTTGWVNNFGTLSVANNVLSAISNGADVNRYMQTDANIPVATGKKVLVRLQVFVDSAKVTNLRLQVIGSTTSGTAQEFNIPTPTPNVWNQFNVIATLPSNMVGNVRIRAIMQTATAADSNGVTMQLKYGLVCDLTTAFTSGKEPAISDMDNFLSQYTNNWFNGTVSYKTLRDVYFSIPVVPETLNPLNGKIATFNGDSIQAGAGESPAKAWAGRLAERNNMTVENKAIGGATLAKNTYNTDTSPRHWIVSDIANMRADADYIILEGGTNDGALSVPVGVIRSGYNDTYDETTICGALESIFRQASLKWIGKKIGFIISYRNVGHQTTDGAVFDNVRQICNKWSIPYLDLYNESGLNANLTDVKTAYMPDGLHLNAAGYDNTLSKVENWLKSL
jgi:lysophospholipase L1-like esterase